jgi:prepilin-type N-terminal cleavage/methylation domain-containing protein
MSSVRRPTGFTLLELIIVLALMGVATTMGTVMFVRVTDTWNRTSTRIELYAKANAVFDQMRQDFGEVVSAKLTGATIRGAAQTFRDNRRLKAALADDQITIPVETVAGPDGRVQRVDVRYHIQRTGGACALMRTVNLPGAPPNAAGTSVKVADGVIAMRIEYLGKRPEAVWQEEWTRPRTPGTARVSVTLADPDRFYEQVSRKAVFPIKVD